MDFSNRIDTQRRTAVYVRISTSMQKTDRQVEELVTFAKENKLNFNEKKDIYRDVISGFKDGEQRPMFSALMEKVRRGEYQQLLFSEFSRLDRKPSNLLRTLETLQKQNVYCWFNKQSIWVKDKNDIGTQIMIQVLAVLSQYEIELFAARGIDGKITALKTRGTSNGGPGPYGYKHSSKDSKLVIDPTEAEVVRRIFNYYIQDKTPTQIVDILNSEGIPCPFWSRLKDAAEKRKDKGLSPKTYRRGDPDNMRWHANNINRIVKNTVYIGKRHFTFYEPDPANPTPAYKRTDRHILTEFDVESPELRIVDDETFAQANAVIESRHINKNVGVHRENLLKTLLVCGECGSRFCTALSTSGPTYKCAAKIKRGCTPRTCLFGADVQQSKLDGLVIKLALLKFAEYDLGKEAKSKTFELQQEIDECSKILEDYTSKQTEADLTFNNYAKRVILVAKNDAEAADWIGKAREEHDRKTAEYGESIARIKTNLAALKRRKRSLTRLKEQSICLRSDQISQDKNLLKEYVHEYIECITLYKPSPLWVLVIVRFVDGSERWGTIKNVRYAKKEVKRDGEYRYTMGFSGWFINNDRHSLSYDKTAHTITEKQSDGKKTYTFEEYDAVVQERKQTDFFEPYVFDVK